MLHKLIQHCLIAVQLEPSLPCNKPILPSLVQGSELGTAAEPSPQQGRIDAHAHKLSQGSLANPPSAQHPLASVLLDLHYAPWQLAATPPQAPKVSITYLSVIAALG